MQAVLLGLYDQSRDVQLTPVPPLKHFVRTGVTMPAMQTEDGGDWRIESRDLLAELGHRRIDDQELAALNAAWRGVLHRVDDPRRFFAAFSRIRDGHPNPLARLTRHVLRPFITLYMMVLIRGAIAATRPEDPTRFADQFLPFESRLAEAPFLEGESPGSLDFMLNGIVQCHYSIPYPPLIAALEADPELSALRAWMGRMHATYPDYERFYSGARFTPAVEIPTPASATERAAFYGGAAMMMVAFPITLPLILWQIARMRRRIRAGG